MKNERGLLTAAAMLGAVAALLWLERRRPLRPAADPGARRIVTNVGVAAVTAVTIGLAERPLVQRLARVVEARAAGLVGRLPVPSAVKTALAVVLMDYTLYWWHVCLHRVPILWRCHLPHHIDRDLDATTALRFHFAEFVASIPWRCAQIVLIGVSPRALALWQRLTTLEVIFHHSNLRLPLALEHALARFVVTPRMHGIHHSIVRDERDSNFSTGLTVWDRLHGTGRFDLSRQPIIGVPGHVDAEAVSLPETLALPFRGAATDQSGERTQR